MFKYGLELIICFTFLISVAVLFFCSTLVLQIQVFKNPTGDYSWIPKGFMNLLGYSTIILPVYCIYRYIKHSNYSDKDDGGSLRRFIERCFVNKLEIIDQTQETSTPKKAEHSILRDGLRLWFYFTGLQVSFLTWGVLQEKIMTQKYTNGLKEEQFRESQFLVCLNRLIAFFLSGTVLLFLKRKNLNCPMYKFMYCSLTNIISSWSLYEALKYVSFPNQVLAKACKPIPVMIIGKILSKRKYKLQEYLTAVVLLIGVVMFTIDAQSTKTVTTTISGVLLLCLFVIFDSFTLNWQGEHFKKYNTHPIEMMCGINFFSFSFTTISLLQQGTFLTCLQFMTEYPHFIFDALLLSLSSACGQLFIFFTISTFGPLVFATIATVRQLLAVLLSCYLYEHKLTIMGILGTVIVFVSIFARIYFNYNTKKNNTKNSADPTVKDNVIKK